MNNHQTPTLLQQQLLLVFALLFVVLGSVLVALNAIWQFPRLGLRAGLTTAGLCFIFFYTYRHLHENHDHDSKTVLPRLGAANTITLLRGVVAVALLFLVGTPRPVGFLGWLPALIFLALVATDSLDGYVARRTHHCTILGKKLDVVFDSLAAFVGILLVIGYKQVPPWFVLVGLVPFGFYGLLRWRRWRGRPIHSLPPSTFRGVVGGVLFGFLCFALAPIFPAVVTSRFAAVLTLVILASFIRDWLYTVGIRQPSKKN